MKERILAIVLVLWLTIILVIFFIVQKPDFLEVRAGLWNLLLAVFIPFFMAALAACMGASLLPDMAPAERLILGTALGMGIFGLTGFFLATSGLATQRILMIILLLLTGYFVLTGITKQVWNDVLHLKSELSASTVGVARWIPLIVEVSFGLAFLLCLAPPAEDFDALSYHLTVPAWWLRDHGLTQVGIPQFWFPQIVEGSFIWPMVLGSDTATHFIHFIWFLLTISLLSHWMQQLWDNSTTWNAILILLTMPSLLWLATWAYTDYTLTFTGIATLYSLWRWKIVQDKKWILISGIMAGIAMSVKYTGFIVPLVGVMIVIYWDREFLQRLEKVVYFSSASIMVASTWYIRNWIWMNNPIYPFVFGGYGWDSFLTRALADQGSGIGYDIRQLLALPLTAILGTHDMNFFDGRIGPFFLILSPLALWVFWKAHQEDVLRKQALQAIGIFSLIGIVVWTLGVINSAHLLQTRLLIPILIPLVIPLSIGMSQLHGLDTRYFRISFVVRSMIIITVLVNLLNFSLQTLARNPVAVAIGIVSREAYMEKRQPGYAHLLLLMKGAPEDAKVYFLFEPRSYGITNDVQPDAINANFSHDLWKYKTPEKMIESWKAQGFTHLLLSRAGADFILQSEALTRPNGKSLLGQLELLLINVGESQSQEYVLYKIP